MSSFAEQVNAIEHMPTNTAGDVPPPRIWWHNGDRKTKTPGNFYTKADEFLRGLDAPWKPDNRFDPEDGYSTPELRIAVLAHRSQPFRKYKDNDGRDQVEYGMKWEPGMSIHTELLILMDGYDGPVVWSMKGMTGAAVTGKTGILRAYEGGLLKEATRIAKRGLPTWAFWLPIRTKLAGDKIAYEDTGYGSFITPPALYLPDNPMDALFVGADVIAKGADILNEMIDWSKYKRLPEGVVEGEVLNTPALPAPRNVPQAIEHTDDY